MVSLARFCKQTATCDCKNSKLNTSWVISRWTLHGDQIRVWFLFCQFLSFVMSISLTSLVSSVGPRRSCSLMLTKGTRNDTWRLFRMAWAPLPKKQCYNVWVAGIDFWYFGTNNRMVWYEKSWAAAGNHDSIQITNVWLILLGLVI